MDRFVRDGVSFRYHDSGDGVPFAFQHGLGGDLEQPLGLSPNLPGIRLISFDCRAHGETEPIGKPEKLSLSQFADDLAALLEHLEITRAIVGGISMGAAVALQFALRNPDRLCGLVQMRPAWKVGPNIDNAAVFSAIARLLRQYGPAEGRRLFVASALYEETWIKSADSAASLLKQFDAPHAVERADRLDRIPWESACDNLNDLAGLTVPAIVLANQQDTIHPFEYGTALGAALPAATFHELTPKSVSVPGYEDDTKRFLSQFLKQFTA